MPWVDTTLTPVCFWCKSCYWNLDGLRLVSGLFVFFMHSHMVGGGTQGFGWRVNGVPRGTVHRPVIFSHGLVRMVWFSRVTLTWYTAKLTLHPWSHSWLTYSRVPYFSSVNVCACRAASGKFTRENKAVCVKLILLTSGSATESGDLVNLRLIHTLVAFRKWPVVTLLTILLLSWWVCRIILRGELST